MVYRGYSSTYLVPLTLQVGCQSMGFLVFRVARFRLQGFQIQRIQETLGAYWDAEGIMTLLGIWEAYARFPFNVVRTWVGLPICEHK